ncbi:LemA family protein [Proteiniclasticum sp.]|uniref:LemA family protein n=1 Tax=Proteiniclasticum sp. TaxID=2053595 RepID=UPI00289D8701|nr:LemA family protein [Proteiniclasticum sp.]
MPTGTVILLIVLGLVVLLVVYGISVYNSLVVLKNRVKNAWAQIEVQLKNRADLIPNLVETVKGYASHEKEVFENVTKARAGVLNAKGVEATAKADAELTSALTRLLVTVEAYPQLKADQNFLSLQAELKDAEEKIRYSRQFYNDTTMKYNTAIQVFPKNIFAGIFNFKQEPLFEASEADRAVPRVQF